jgi:hypothetical protein
MTPQHRTLLVGREPLAVCKEVVERGLHPEAVDVDTGVRVMPLVLNDRRHFTLWMRLYSRTLAARNLAFAGDATHAQWEIEAAIMATTDPPCFLESVYLDELRLLLRSAQRALAAGETGVDHYGPHISLLVAENWCLMRLYRRQVQIEDVSDDIAEIAQGRAPHHRPD